VTCFVFDSAKLSLSESITIRLSRRESKKGLCVREAWEGKVLGGERGRQPGVGVACIPRLWVRYARGDMRPYYLLLLTELAAYYY
jgi:hypothetical protein